VYAEAIDLEISDSTYPEKRESVEVLEPQEALDMIFGGVE
jgi:hypothetical protein